MPTPVQSVHKDDHQSKYTYASFGKLRILGFKPGDTPGATMYTGCAWVSTAGGVPTGKITENKRFEYHTRYWRSADGKTTVLWPVPIFPTTYPGAYEANAFFGDTTKQWVRANNKKILVTGYSPVAAALLVSVSGKRYLKMFLMKEGVLYYRVKSLDDVTPDREWSFGSWFQSFNGAMNFEFNQSATAAVNYWSTQISQFETVDLYTYACDDIEAKPVRAQWTQDMLRESFFPDVVNGHKTTDYSVAVNTITPASGTTSGESTFNLTRTTTTNYRDVTLHAAGYKGDVLGLVYTKSTIASNSTEARADHTYPHYVTPTFIAGYGDVSLPARFFWGLTEKHWSHTSSSLVEYEYAIKYINGDKTVFHTGSVSDSGSSHQDMGHFYDSTSFPAISGETTYGTITEFWPVVYMTSVSSNLVASPFDTYRFVDANIQEDFAIWMKEKTTPGSGSANQSFGFPNLYKVIVGILGFPSTNRMLTQSWDPYANPFDYGAPLNPGEVVYARYLAMSSYSQTSNSRYPIEFVVHSKLGVQSYEIPRVSIPSGGTAPPTEGTPWGAAPSTSSTVTPGSSNSIPFFADLNDITPSNYEIQNGFGQGVTHFVLPLGAIRGDGRASLITSAINVFGCPTLPPLGYLFSVLPLPAYLAFNFDAIQNGPPQYKWRGFHLTWK